MWECSEKVNNNIRFRIIRPRPCLIHSHLDKAVFHFSRLNLSLFQVKQRIIDVDTKNSLGLIGHIEELSHNALAVYWNPLESPAKVNLAVQCLSTDFRYINPYFKAIIIVIFIHNTTDYEYKLSKFIISVHKKGWKVFHCTSKLTHMMTPEVKWAPPHLIGATVKWRYFVTRERKEN